MPASRFHEDRLHGNDRTESRDLFKPTAYMSVYKALRDTGRHWETLGVTTGLNRLCAEPEFIQRFPAFGGKKISPAQEIGYYNVLYIDTW